MIEQWSEQNGALAPSTWVRLEGIVVLDGEALTAPASNLPCVHYHLRVFERLAAGMELVHEMSSPTPLVMAPQGRSGGDGRPVRIPLDGARLEGQPTLHHEGSPGALAVAKRFGLLGAVRVEEVLVKAGERIQAEGLLLDPSAEGAGPYRATSGPAELLDATVRCSSSIALRPAILPWALGTAAALLGTSAAAATLAQVFRTPTFRPGLSAPAEIGAAKVGRPRWP